MSHTPGIDAALTIGLIGAFALLVATHVATVYGVSRRGGVGKGLGALFVPPLAPYWAARAGLRVRAGLWVLGAVAYVALVLAARS